MGGGMREAYTERQCVYAALSSAELGNFLAMEARTQSSPQRRALCIHSIHPRAGCGVTGPTDVLERRWIRKFGEKEGDSGGQWAVVAVRERGASILEGESELHREYFRRSSSSKSRHARKQNHRAGGVGTIGGGK